MTQEIWKSIGGEQFLDCNMLLELLDSIICRGITYPCLKALLKEEVADQGEVS